MNLGLLGFAIVMSSEFGSRRMGWALWWNMAKELL